MCEIKLIHIYGTSHVSEESLKLVEEKINQHDPDIVALELDYLRLKALIEGERTSTGPLFVRIIQKFQESIGGKTGVMPGEEMLHAHQKAVKEERNVALIDRDIRETIKDLKKVKTREKIKILGHTLLELPFKHRFDYSKIPDEEMIQKLLEELEFKFPGLYNVLVKQRNQHMTQSLKRLQEENPEKDIVVFVGAAHRKDIQNALNK